MVGGRVVSALWAVWWIGIIWYVLSHLDWTVRGPGNCLRRPRR